LDFSRKIQEVFYNTRASIDEVNIKLMQYMRRMDSQMQNILAESRQAVKKEQMA
jgi:hypothetical protein